MVVWPVRDLVWTEISPGKQLHNGGGEVAVEVFEGL
jgi:hypothetical protein